MRTVEFYPMLKGAPLLYRQAQPDALPTRLLVLLHGVGGDETNLISLGTAISNDTLVVWPRGPLAIGPTQFAWFPVRFEPTGPEIDFVQAQRSTLLLLELLKHLQTRHAISPSRTVIAGFSQGGIMSANVALTTPTRVAGFGVLCGRILPQIEPGLSTSPHLQALDALVIHGSHDTRLPPKWAERADALLSRLNVPHVTHYFPAGHEISPAMAHHFLSWFEHAEARWNTDPCGPCVPSLGA